MNIRSMNGKQLGFFDLGLGLGLMLLFGGTAVVVAPEAPETPAVAKAEQHQAVGVQADANEKISQERN